jgi:tripartite ATP-independent transporter DctM subunit
LDWWLILICLLGGAIFMLFTGIPVAFAFILVSLVGSFIFWGGEIGLRQYVVSLFSSLNSFVLIGLVLFTLMGEILVHSKIAFIMVDIMSMWLGKMPGKLGVLAVMTGTLLSVLSGAGSATTAILGTTLTPEMERRGYKKSMSLGPILGSGGLAVMIPPSGLAILIGGLANISVGGLLIGGIVPGLLMAFSFACYVVIRCWLQPSIAPPYYEEPTPISKRLVLTVRYIFPVAIVVFAVLGLMFLGIATPSEAAATGVVGSLLLVAIHGKLNWVLIKKSIMSTANVTGMLFLIIAGGAAFSQILAFSGATQNLVKLVANLPLTAFEIVIVMQFCLLVLGCFMSVVPILLITLPVFMPVVFALGINEIWFGVLTLLSMEMSGTTPPFGSYLFVMKAVAPPGTTMGDCYRAGLPFLACDFIVMILMFAFPPIVTWLPGLMR